MEEDKIIRAFIAIELPAKISEELNRVQKELKDGVNKVTWIKTGNVHLTIKFLGDIEAKKVNSIEQVLESVACKSHVFNITIKRTGVFPSMDSPRIIWVGVEENGANLAQLYNNLEDSLTTLGFEKEERTFKPHLTMGRIKFLKDKKLLKQRLEKNADINLGQFAVDSLYLFESKLTPEGAVYTKLKEAKLKTGNREQERGKSFSLS
ncbi:MAG: RNA 2',3'-cyclic phosphodiesterase [Deltaproteobacteria bacterium]|nr:RNA 2',3'-cyclic phosphodiesterase [Deltaproteobacteria bacterium]